MSNLVLTSCSFSVLVNGIPGRDIIEAFGRGTFYRHISSSLRLMCLLNHSIELLKVALLNGEVGLIAYSMLLILFC